MPDLEQMLPMFNQIGREVLDVFWLPSMEALILGTLIWVVLRLYQDHAPKFRHVLWILVILKPLVSILLPWQGPFSLPWHPVLIPIGTGAYTAGSDPSWWALHAYTIVGTVWTSAVAFGLIWTIIGTAALYWQSKQALPVMVPWIQALLDRCHSSVGIKHPIKLRMSDAFAGPTLIAIGKPVIIVPSWCLIQLSPQELKQVFLHEMLHYARRDHFTVLLVQFSKIIFFFHPLIWYAGKRISIEAERACDAAVIRVSRKPESYASSLLKVAEGALGVSRWRGVLEMAKSASLTALRIRDVLSGAESRHVVGFRALIIVGLCVLLCVTPLFHVPVSVPFVRFTGETQQIATAPPTNISLAQIHETLIPFDERPRTLAIAPPPIDVAEALKFSKTEPVRNMVADGRPYARRSMAVKIRSQALSSPPTDLVEQKRPNIAQATLGLPEVSTSLVQPRASGWSSGQIEVQGIGQTPTRSVFSNALSLRAGYFVTRTHEFGGVFSIVSPTDLFAENDREQSDNSAGPSSVRARRLTSSVFSSLVSSPNLGSDQRDAIDNEPVEQIMRIGGFYRYNLAGLSSSLVPFIGIGAGVEVRPGRKPKLIESGAGVRYFWAKRAALILQLDYQKEVEFTTRSYINASLGFSAIF
jgi:beta-lactamase regulating signal transducer with metallopeptidase domain